MKNLVNKLKVKLSKLDNVDRFGLVFGLFVFLPLLTVLVVDVINNGARML
jgi:hypothetical protein